MRKRKPWWYSWAVEDLSPLNPEAVVSMQLVPILDCAETYVKSCSPAQYAQLWWLCWHARPDLREQLRLRYHMLVQMGTVIHPETVKEFLQKRCVMFVTFLAIVILLPILLRIASKIVRIVVIGVVAIAIIAPQAHIWSLLQLHAQDILRMIMGVIGK